MSKGSNFEREICRELSEWWSCGKRDDLFWRTSMSGGRATVRNRQGKETHGQYGDIMATHPMGNSLIRLTTIELKRGYSGASFIDLIDKPVTVHSLYRDFFKQARKAARLAGTPSWWLIVKRDRREALLFMPASNARTLAKSNWEASAKIQPSCLFTVKLGKRWNQIACFPYQTFLSNFGPEDMLLAR